jgi:hypothetical protein
MWNKLLIWHVPIPQEAGGTLIGENGAVVTTEVELVEGIKHGFQVFDAIPLLRS